MRTERPHEYSYYSSGKWFTPQRYVIGWRQLGVLKVGTTSNGRSRYGRFLARGGELLDLRAYPISKDLDAEGHLIKEIERRWIRAFNCREESLNILGGRGDGWTECFLVDPEDWGDALNIAIGGEENSLVQGG